MTRFDELQEKWKDEETASVFLENRGWKRADNAWFPPGPREITADEFDAMSFLFIFHNHEGIKHEHEVYPFD